MADNTQLNARTTDGDIVATDDIGGVKHQRVKMQYGDDGSATDASFNKPFPVDLIEPRFDAFGRLRVSEPLTVFDIQHQYNTMPLFWDDTISGGSIAHLPNESSVRLRVGTASGESVSRTTKQHFRYQPGKSQLITLTGVLGTKKTNVVQRIGYFDDNNGLLFEQDASNLKVVVRTFTSGGVVNNAVNQSAWNLDSLDGNGPSGLTLDMSKIQIFIIDMQWLGAGRIRFGFVIDGKVVYCHESNHANLDSVVYMTTANLPIQYSVENVGVSGSTTDLLMTCCSVVSEGGFVKEGIPFSANNGVTAISVTTRRNVLSIRPKATFNSISNTGLIIPKAFSIFAASKDVFYEIVQGGSMTDASWASADANSIVEYDVTGTTVSNGRIIDSGYISTGKHGSATPEGVLNKVPLSDSEALSIVVTSLTTATDVYAAINWSEIY